MSKQIATDCPYCFRSRKVELPNAEGSKPRLITTDCKCGNSYALEFTPDGKGGATEFYSAGFKQLQLALK